MGTNEKVIIWSPLRADYKKEEKMNEKWLENTRLWETRVKLRGKELGKGKD